MANLVNYFQRPRIRSATIHIGLILLLGPLFFALIKIIGALQITYFDSYSILQNAKTLKNLDGGFYYWYRPLLLPWLISFLGSSNLIIQGLPLIFLALFLISSYKFVRLHTDVLTASIGVFLLSLNRMIIHQAPFMKEDILGAGLLTASIYCFLKFKEKGEWRYFTKTSLLIMLLALTRLQLLPVIFIFFGICEMSMAKGFSKRMVQKLIYMCIVPIFCAFCIIAFHYQMIYQISFLSGMKLFFKHVFAMFQHNSTGESMLEYFGFILRSSGWGILTLVTVGIFVAWREKQKGRWVHLLYFGIVLLFHGVVVGHKEARYLMPALVSMYFFAALGLVGLLRVIESMHILRFKIMLKLSLLLICLITPIKEAIGEIQHFKDPIYTKGFHKKVSLKAKELAGRNDIHWIGPQYPVHPKEYVFHQEDEFFYIYHFHANAVEYYSDKKVLSYISKQIRLPGPPRDGFFVHNITEHVNDGDVLIVNVEPKIYTTKILPEQLKPLIVEKVKKYTFSMDKTTGFFRSDELPEATLKFQQSILSGDEIPLRQAEIYIKTRDSKKLESFPIVKLLENDFFTYTQG